MKLYAPKSYRRLSVTARLIRVMDCQLVSPCNEHGRKAWDTRQKSFNPRGEGIPSAGTSSPPQFLRRGHISTTIRPGALARLFELHDKTPAVLTADDWAVARAEFSRYSIALRTIAQMWDGGSVPDLETYHDTESAYNNGHDVACYEAAKVAREAIAAGEAAAFDRELLDLARRKLVEFHGGRVTLTREGYLAITRLFGRP